MRIFEYQSYRKFLRARLKTLPSHGRGELTKMAQALGVHTTMISHIMKGSADFSIEQTLKLADHLAFNSLETDYLLALVQVERAGDQRTRAYCQSKLSELQTRALDLSGRLKTQNELSDEDRAFYYSSPTYSHVRLLCAIERFQIFEVLQAETKIPPNRLRGILDFLTSRKLCVEKNGRFIYAELPTYLEASSPLVARHHLNWRQKTQEKIENLRAEDLVFTFPTVISESDFQIIREKLVQFIEEFKKISGPSPSENLYCLNIDWLKHQ
ncbi:MAG: TIGR02147 family protein [Pseudobdellovibrionaceae bacterium]